MTGASSDPCPMDAAPTAVVKTATGRSGISGQGPFYEVTLEVRDGIAVAASFRTFGCIWAETIGAMAMAMITGKQLAECRALSVPELLERLIEGIPRSKEDLPGMVCVAVWEAAAAVEPAASGS